MTVLEALMGIFNWVYAILVAIGNLPVETLALALAIAGFYLALRHKK